MQGEKNKEYHQQTEGFSKKLKVSSDETNVSPVLKCKLMVNFSAQRCRRFVGFNSAFVTGQRVKNNISPNLLITKYLPICMVKYKILLGNYHR